MTLSVFASILIHGSLVSGAYRRIARRRETSPATKPHRVLTRGGSVLKPLNAARSPRESFRVVPLALGRLRARLCRPSRSGPPTATRSFLSLVRVLLRNSHIRRVSSISVCAPRYDLPARLMSCHNRRARFQRVNARIFDGRNLATRKSRCSGWRDEMSGSLRIRSDEINEVEEEISVKTTGPLDQFVTFIERTETASHDAQ